VALALFADVGAEPLREAEVMHRGRGDGGGYACVWWLHVIGEVEGPTHNAAPGYVLAPGFKVWAVAKDDMALPPFRDRGLIQLEFATEVPWLLAEPAPDAGAGTSAET
jgi:hypothetical protein